MSIGKNQILKGACINGLFNAIVNASISWLELKEENQLFLTVDSITSTQETVLGSAVLMAASLACILTLISYFTFKSANKVSFFPRVILLTIRNTFFAFGIIVTFSILIQRIFGSLTVSANSAVLIIGIIAGLVAGIVDYLTKTELLSLKK